CLLELGYLNNNGEVSKVILSEEKITDAITAATKRFKMYLGLFRKLDEYAQKKPWMTRRAKKTLCEPTVTKLTRVCKC
ncbi:hypothetical protein V3C99_004149, partial [Haemonchus contortus]